jgi:hypothetical protein
MAYQNGKPAPAKILRTPAPDEITNVRHPSAQGPGMNGPQPSSVAPGQASESVLAQNLRQSSDPEDLLGQVVRAGVSGRDDRLPNDGGDYQRRTVSDTAYPTAHGCEGAKPGPKMSAAVDTTAIASPVRKPS